MRIAALALTFTLAASTAAVPAHAQKGQEGVDAMIGAIQSGCGAMNAQFRKTPGMGTALSARPESALCECVEKRIADMPLIRDLRSYSDEKLETLIEEADFRDYLVSKLSVTMFTCLTEELDAGAEKIKPAM
jgi:hypothetical protein